MSDSAYKFERYGVLFRDDHPMALYAGNRRLSPRPVLVWWWPINWIVVLVALPIAIWNAARKAPGKGIEP